MTTPPAGNPAPRAALRKAGDAGIHPAIGTVGADPDRTGASPARARIAAVPAAEEPPAEGPKGKNGKGKKGKGKTADRRFRGATSDVLRHPEPRESDILLGKQVSLHVQVPKRLRKAARAQAQRQGTTIDEVVTGLLAGWVDGS